MSNIFAILYEKASGAIVQAASVQEESWLPEPDLGYAWMVAQHPVDIKNCYVDSYNIIRNKKELELKISSFELLADGTSEVLIENIPQNTLVTWPDNQVDKVLDAEIRFSVDLPGTYTFVFEAVEYLRKEVTIEAVPATES